MKCENCKWEIEGESFYYGEKELCEDCYNKEVAFELTIDNFISAANQLGYKVKLTAVSTTISHYFSISDKDNVYQVRISNHNSGKRGSENDAEIIVKDNVVEVAEIEKFIKSF